MASNKGLVISLPVGRRSAVLFSYSLNIETRHNSGSSAKAWKKISFGGPDFLVLVRPGMLKVAPASEKWRYLRSNAWISDDLLPFDKASSMTSFLLKVVRSSSAITGNDCMKLTTWLTFQIA